MTLFDMDAVIIREEKYLTEDFVPEEMLHRDGQKQEVANSLKPAIAGRTPGNLFLYGPTGTGKTSMIKWIFQELEKNTQKAKCVYVNVWRKDTTHAILTEILRQLNIFTTLKQSRNEMLDLLNKNIKNNGYKLVICLDEIDQLRDEELLYTFSRDGHSLVLISNDKYALMDLDDRIKSSLTLNSIEFPKYSPKDIENIIAQRSEYGLIQNAIVDEHLRIIAHQSRGDARVAIDLLRKSVLNAESDNCSKIDIKHVKKAIDEKEFLRKSKVLPRLNPHQKLLYEIIEQEKQIESGKLYELYSNRSDSPVIDRTYRKFMTFLVNQKIIESISDGRWRKYRIINE